MNVSTRPVVSRRMVITALLFEIHIPHAQSLKEKRMVVKSLRERLRNRFEVSAAEVALHDLHQRARIAVAAVSIDDAAADALLSRIQSFVESAEETLVTGWTVEKLAFDANESLGIPGFS